MLNLYLLLLLLLLQHIYIHGETWGAQENEHKMQLHLFNDYVGGLNKRCGHANNQCLLLFCTSIFHLNPPSSLSLSLFMCSFVAWFLLHYFFLFKKTFLSCCCCCNVILFFYMQKNLHTQSNEHNHKCEWIKWKEEEMFNICCIFCCCI